MNTMNETLEHMDNVKEMNGMHEASGGCSVCGVELSEVPAINQNQELQLERDVFLFV